MKVIRKVSDTNSFNTAELLRHLNVFFKTMVIKYDRKAKAAETDESKRSSDRYLTALNGTSNEYTYGKFTRNVMIKAGVSELIVDRIEDSSEVPAEYLKECIRLQDIEILETYEEENPYYRPYCGLPITERGKSLFAPMWFYDELLIEPTPVYRLNDTQILLMEREGILKDLQEENPGELFLHYLGINKIDVRTLRLADNFAIVYVDTTDLFPDVYASIIDAYSKCRDVVMGAYYNHNLVTNIPYYENFLAMTVMSNAIHVLINHYFRKSIERDYFDLQTIKLFYDAYEIPFVKELPISQHRLFCKNLNYLLSMKGTNEVFFHICKLFNMERIKFYRYYLIKEHVRDKDKYPIFKYDANGDLDIDQTYDYYFQLVDFNELDLTTAFRDNRLRREYTDITKPDGYWLETAKLKEKLNATKFNYTSTKYFAMHVMNSVTQMMFEMQYQLKLLTDKKADTQLLIMKVPDLFGDIEINLFDLVVLIHALMCKKLGFKGNILMSPPSISKVYGFNIKADITKLIELALTKPYCNQNLKNYFIDMSINSFDDVSRLFTEIEEFKAFLEQSMRYTQDKEEYQLYERLWKQVLIADESYDAYRIDEDNVATTYLEYLSHKNTTLHNYLQDLKPEDVDSAMGYIHDELKGFIPELEHLYAFQTDSSVVLEAIIKMILYFKSYTVELNAVESIKCVDDWYSNKLKTIETIRYETDVRAYDSIDVAFDGINRIECDITTGDRDKMRHEYIIIRDKEETRKYE